MQELFGTAGTKTQVEQVRTELPLKKWFVARTSDSGGAAPKMMETKADGTAFGFKTGLYVIGGDGKSVTEKMRGSYAFFQAFLRPNYKEQGGPKSQEDYDTLNGRLVGFINTVLSPGIEDKAERWNNSLRILSEHAALLADEKAGENRLTPEMFDIGEGESKLRDNAEYIARVFTLYLQANPRNVIVNLTVDTGKDKDREDIVVGSFKDATEANAKNSKTQPGLTMFPGRDGEIFDLYGAVGETGEDATAF